MRYQLFILLFSALAGAARASAAQAGGSDTACLRYDRDTVRLAGMLERHTYPGAPNFESVRAGDAAETGFYLNLAAPICARPAPGQDPRDDAAITPRDSVRRIQLVLDSAGFARLRPFLGQRVVIRGKLFSSYTGHHHAPVLLNVLEPVQVER